MEDTSKRHRRCKGLLAPTLLVLVGVVLLLEKTGVIQRELLSHWWPLLLIFVGGWLLITRMNRKRDES